MSILTKKYLPRRTFLRGSGVASVATLLDGMVRRMRRGGRRRPRR